MRTRGGKISNINKAMILSIVLILFFMISSVSAIDLDTATDDSNLLNENNKIVFSSQNLEVSSYNSVSENLSHDDNLENYSSYGDDGLLTSQYVSEDIVNSNETVSTSLTGNDTELYFKNGTAFKILLTDVNGSALIGQNVVFTINGNSYNRTTDGNGIASIKINLNPGRYNITSFYAGNGSYENSSATNIVKVLSTISGDDIEKYFRNDTQYFVTLVDGQGNLLKNAAVNFNINGVFYERKTNGNGTARLNINLNPGEYIITVTNPINNDLHSNCITVLPTILADDVMKYYKNDTQYYVTLLDNTGKPVSNKDVTLNINGLQYTRTTNENGTARLNINLMPGEYVITATSSFNGELHSNTINVLPTIFANNLTMVYRNGSRFSAYVIDGNGNPLNNSTVVFNVNGVLYNRISDENGYASLNINLNTGTYIITSTNEKGLPVSNIITVNKCNSTIEADDFHVIAGIDRDYTVKVMGNNNKSVNGVLVIFQFEGKTVGALTNENGEATVKITNPSEGNYSMACTFDGDFNYYPSKASSNYTVANSTVKFAAEDLNMTYKDGSRFTVNLTDLEGKPLVNETVIFTINGVDYNRTTNDQGVAGLNINLIPGNYVISYSHSQVNEEDYNWGSNNLTVCKLPAKLIADDLYMKYGEEGAFVVNLTDANNSALEGIGIKFTINGASYTRMTDSSGIAKLNIHLGVGYYEVKSSFIDVIYAADSITNHILVDGFILSAKEMTVFTGTNEVFPVSVSDPYGKPVSGASISFSYAGKTVTSNTDANGIATAPLNGLAKGDYLIVYTFTAADTAGQSYVHVLGTIPISSLIGAANSVNTYIERNANLPPSVTIGDTTYSAAQYLYLLSEAILNINRGDLSNLYVYNVNNPSNPGAAANMGSLSDYISVASTMLTGMDRGNTPNSVSTSIGNIGYDGIFYALTRVVVYYGMMGSLPSSVSIKSLTLYQSKSSLDEANTISNLAPYLSDSSNCYPSNGEIAALANQLVRGITNSVDKATAIYNYVRDSVSYSFYYDTKYGSVGTLHAKSGNCVDQAHLLIALYRAAGLPARYVHGTCTFSDGTFGHVWAQVLIGNTWVVSDPTSTRNSFGKVVNWNNNNYYLKAHYASLPF